MIVEPKVTLTINRPNIIFPSREQHSEVISIFTLVVDNFVVVADPIRRELNESSAVLHLIDSMRTVLVRRDFIVKKEEEIIGLDLLRFG